MRVTSRRRLLAAAPLSLLLLRAGLRSTAAQAASHDSTAVLQREINAAAETGRVAVIPPGVSYVSNLSLPSTVRLVGAGPSTRLVAIGDGPMLSAEQADSIAIENMRFDGDGRAPGGNAGLIEMRDVLDLRFIDCAIERVAGSGLLMERCGGHIERSTFRTIADAALHSLDSLGLSVVDNEIEDCGNAGIQIWRSAEGDDRSVLRGNRVTRIRADHGGDGEYGNGINIFRAGGIVCEGNVVRACAFSAVRYNAGSNATIVSNNIGDCGEVALYVEFGFQGAVVEANVIDGASSGISITNFDQGGRLAACNGNVVRNLDRPNPQNNGVYGIGIDVEADTVVSGNTIDNATGTGLRLGYGSALRNVIAANNVISDCGIGIDVSVVGNKGPASISNNVIAGAKHGVIVGMAWDKIQSDDLLRDAAQYPQLTMAGNIVR
jgi:uncharacterized secreted repeat protein (TIGR03808 family)